MTTLPLADQHCTGYGPDARALTPAEIDPLLHQIPDWAVRNADATPRLERVFKFPNFVTALAFTNAVANMAEAEDHHPTLITEWGRVTVQWWTHRVAGLHLNDFIAAAKTDRIFATPAPDLTA